jgi:hypothetical protein
LAALKKGALDLALIRKRPVDEGLESPRRVRTLHFF